MKKQSEIIPRMKDALNFRAVIYTKVFSHLLESNVLDGTQSAENMLFLCMYIYYFAAGYFHCLCMKIAVAYPSRRLGLAEG